MQSGETNDEGKLPRRRHGNGETCGAIEKKDAGDGETQTRGNESTNTPSRLRDIDFMNAPAALLAHHAHETARCQHGKGNWPGEHAELEGHVRRPRGDEECQRDADYHGAYRESSGSGR